ncbi:MAG: Mur ligase family protein [Gemmatimonadota bacterium]
MTTRSDEVRPGSLFVAIRGTSTDGHAFVGEAVARGAAAVVVERDFPGDPGVPTLRVDDTRRASAELAAAWYGHPARRLRLVGITGSLGKTSILSMLEAMVAETNVKVGAVGSLGVHVDQDVRSDTGHTAPGPLLLHRELARLAAEGCELVAMEVTSHALVQERVHGLRFDLGVFTNLVPLEHSEFHPTFRDYAAAKVRFFDHLRPCAPLVFNIDSRVVRRLVHEADAEPIGCGTGRAALVRVDSREMDADGSRFELDVRRPLPRVGGGETPTGRFPLRLRLLGYANIANAALAATAALCLGVGPEAIGAALAGLPRQPRRLQLIHQGRFIVLDDTVGHPDSISALFQVVERFEPRRVHVAFAVRGQRGERVNRHTAEALAIWSRSVPSGRMVVTRSEEAADERNQVEDRELSAVTDALRAHGVVFEIRERLDAAVRDVLAVAQDGDLVLLLGAQGMDPGQEVARAWLGQEVGPTS